MDKLEFTLNSLESVMADRFGRYSKYIIQERALPDVRDGLKPVQRRILYAMYADGNVPEKPYRKSAKTVGLVIGNYHPHGDTSVYEAMVRLSQYWKMNIPLVDMQGNNGSIDDDPAAAMRYTEARLSSFGQFLLNDIDQNTVNFTPNFDDTSSEPSVLPGVVPQLLVNGATGIAAGYATNIPPHNLKEVIEACIYRLNNQSCTINDLLDIMQGPDFPTGGIVQGKKGILDAFSTGKGRVVIRAKAEIVQAKNIQQIIITEIPYEVIKSNLVKKMDDIRLNKQIDGIIDVRDESDRTGLKIVIDIKKESDANLILNYFYKNTDCQIFYNYNMVAIVNQRPVLCSVIDMLDAFTLFRKEVIIRRSTYQLNEMERRSHILEGLIKAISVLDEVILIIRSSSDKSDAKNNLIARFDFTLEQAEAIVSLRLYRLTNTDIIEIKEELAQLSVDMQRLKGILSNETLLNNVFIKELQEVIKLFDTRRRSKIESEVEEIIINKMSMIPNEKTVLTVSRDGYIKRISVRSYQSSEGILPALKEGDQLIGICDAETYDTILLFSDNGSYAIIPLYTLEEMKWKDIGNHYGNYVKTEDRTKLISAILVKSFNTDAYIVSVSEKGFIKKSMIKDYQATRTSKTYDAMNLIKNDKLVSNFLVYQDDEIVVSSQEGYFVRYTFEMIPCTQPKSKGVKAMNISLNDKVAYACALNQQNAVLLITENGLMKRIKQTELSSFNRPAKGELIAKKVKSNPQNIQHVQSVQVYDEIKITHDSNLWIQAKDVPIMDKTQTFSQVVDVKKGFYLMKTIEEVKIVDFKEVIKKEPIKQLELIEENEEEHHDEVEFIHFDL
jgi:topoisomerase-4 subunit A